jgi:hypothetical protein
MEFTLQFTQPDGRIERIQVAMLSFVFDFIEKRLPIIRKNKEIITITVNNELDKSMDFPSQGVLFTKDLMKRLDYIKVDEVYEFYISKGKVKKCDNYVKIKYKKVTNVVRCVDYNHFIKYLNAEGYIDEK